MKRLISRLLALALAAMLCLGAVPAFAAEDAAWDGTTIDVSWYDPDLSELYIATPEQLMGLAAIVNGIYNREITHVIGNADYIVDSSSDTLDSGSNNKASSVYHYGADSFKGKTVYLTADLDMGGVYDSASGTWSGPRYMPIGGQYLMEKNDGETKLSSSFCGVFDGQGHYVYNIYCDRHCSNGNFGDGSSVGLIGRLGVHDGDDVSLRPVEPTVRNVGVAGYIRANRSVGGIVGKTGKTTANSGDGSLGAVIENCVNYAAVSNTDAKGCGGIVGAGWNGGVVRNCYNLGSVSTSYACPTAGISGSNEITLENCYNAGAITAPRGSYAMALGTNNGGAPYKYAVKNCWYLDGSAPGGGYYSNGAENAGALSAAELRAAADRLGEAFTAREGAFPILAWEAAKPRWFDVAASAWYAADVEFASAAMLFDAAAPGLFAPEAPMTRAMLVTALYRLAGAPEAAPTDRFRDVAASADYAAAVAWAYAAGVVSGVSETEFAPDATIPREQIVTMFYRYAKLVAGADMSPADDLARFTDRAAVSAWARDAMSWAVAAGLITGMAADTIVPAGTTTRAQCAALVHRLAEQVK